MEGVNSYYPNTRSSGTRIPIFTVDLKRQQREFETMCWEYGKILLNRVKILLYNLYHLFELRERFDKQYDSK